MPTSRLPPWPVLFLLRWAGCVPSTGQVERGLERELQKLIRPAAQRARGLRVALDQTGR